MSRIENDLLPNEKLIFSTKISPTVFLPVVLAIVLFLYVMSQTLELLRSKDQFLQIFGSIMCLFSISFLLAIIFLIIRGIIVMASNGIFVTSRRMIFKTGTLRRNVVEIPLQYIESVGVNQSLIGRLLLSGTVIVTGLGGTSQRVQSINNPMMVKQKINQIIDYVHTQVKPQQ
jgi:uncharacterized membrane protein YdbT with pleckstrin-like domain